MDLTGAILELPLLADLAQSEWLLGLALLAITATLVGFSIPGVLVPLSFSSGALLGGWLGMVVVMAGAVLGSQAFFLVGRHMLGPRLREKLGHRLHKFDRHLSERGFLYVAGLRVVGVPHFLVTGASALSPIRARTFAMATLVGLLPAIAIAATAGSVV